MTFFVGQGPLEGRWGGLLAALLVLLGGLVGCDESSPQSVERCDMVVFYVGEADDKPHLVGEFNDWQPQAMDRYDEETWVKILRPGEGRWRYRIEVDGEEHLDIFNPLTHFDEEGQEASVVYLADCGVPAIEVRSVSADAAGSVQVEVQFEAADSGAAAQQVWAEFGGEEHELSALGGDRYRLELSGLGKGKHRLVVNALDEDGIGAGAQQVPFWIEDFSFDWEDALIYQVVVDRFSNGQGALQVDDAISFYHGGDLWGVIAAIESGYFEDLGVNALWLSPLNDNPDGQFVGRDGYLAEAYHGYWAIEPREVESKFGGADALDALIEAAHARGIRVIVDFVLNHAHEEHPYVREHMGARWFNNPDGDCVCGMTCSWGEHMEDCWFDPFMPDFNWKSPEVGEQLIEDALWWIDRFDLDGLRLDAVPMMPRLAMRHLRDRVDASFEHPGGPEVYLMGETYTSRGQQTIIAHYVGPAALDGQFDFPLMWALRAALTGADSFAALDAEIQKSSATWESIPGAIMAPIIGNHDVPRIISALNNDTLWEPRTDPPAKPSEQRPYLLQQLAFSLLLTHPGAPILYYGDEIGIPGGYDPDNRRDMRFAPNLDEWEAELLGHVQRLGQARACSQALRRGERKTLFVGGDVYVWGRRDEAGNMAVVAINRSGGNSAVSFRLPSSWDSPLLGDLFGGDFTVDGQQVELNMAALSSMLLLSEAGCLSD